MLLQGLSPLLGTSPVTLDTTPKRIFFDKKNKRGGVSMNMLKNINLRTVAATFRIKVEVDLRPKTTYPGSDTLGRACRHVHAMLSTITQKIVYSS